MKTLFLILQVALSCITYSSSTAAMTSSVMSSIMPSEGSISLSSTEETPPSGEAVAADTDSTLPKSMQTHAANSVDDIQMSSFGPTSASAALGSFASSTLGTSSSTASQPEQTDKDSPDVMTHSGASTPTLPTSTAPPLSSAMLTDVVITVLHISTTFPPSAFSTASPSANVSVEDETTVLISSTSFLPSASTLSVPVPTASAEGDSATPSSNVFVPLTSTPSTPLPTAAPPTENMTTASTTTTTLIPPVTISSKPVPTAISNSASLTAMAPSSVPKSGASAIASVASQATFAISTVSTPEAKPNLSDSVLTSSWLMVSFQAATPSAIASSSPTTTSRPITPGLSSTLTISTLMTSPPVTQELQDSTEGSIDDTHLPTAAVASASAETSTTTVIDPEQTYSLEVSQDSLHRTTLSSLGSSTTSSSLVITETPSPLALVSSSSSLLPSETSSSFAPTAEYTSLAPSASSSSLASTATLTSMVPSGTSPLTSTGPSSTLMASRTSSSLATTTESMSLTPSARSSSLVPSTPSMSRLPSATSGSLTATLVPSGTSTLTSTGSSSTLMASRTSSSLATTTESTSLTPSARSSSLVPSAASMSQLPSATSGSLTTTDSLSILSSTLPSTSAAHTTSVFSQTASTLSLLVSTPTSTSTAASAFPPSTSTPPSESTDTTPSPASTQTSPTFVTSASPSEQTGSDKTSVIIGVSIGVVILLAVVVTLLVVVKLRVIDVRPLYDRMGPKTTRRSSDTTIEMTLVDTTDIEISGLGKYIASKMKNRALDEEYKTLPSRPVDYSNEHAGQLPCNKMKNRFADIFAYDCSRVVLQRGESTDTDYINANYITGYNHKPRAYIAAQGPNVQSLDDFWLMVWQQDVRCIVMLTNLRENNKRKCEKYWPDEGSRERYGDVDVSCTCEDVMSTYVVRLLQTSLHTVANMTKETRRIVQYHFTTWPDHGVPSAPSLVEFWQHVKDEMSSNSPLLVHCSAGVGRTGTFIGLDALMERCKVESTVNVFNFVSSMRGERMCTVQTRRQYTFLHLVLLEALCSEGTHRLSEELVGGIRCEEEHIYEEFQRIQELAALNWNAPEEDAEADVDGVSYVPSYASDVEFLVTSSLPNNAATHVWTVVDEYKATLVIAICDYVATGIIPSPMGETMLDDTLLLTLKSSSSVSEHVLKTEIVAELDDGSHSDEEDKPLTVTVFSTPSVTDSVGDVLTLVQKLENTRNLAAESIIVYSSPDSHPAMLMCTIWNIIQRLQRQSGVDIFLAVREMQSVIPSYHISQDDYRFLFKIASEYVTSTSIYANAYV